MVHLCLQQLQPGRCSYYKSMIEGRGRLDVWVSKIQYFLFQFVLFICPEKVVLFLLEQTLVWSVRICLGKMDLREQPVLCLNDNIRPLTVTSWLLITSANKYLSWEFGFTETSLTCVTLHWTTFKCLLTLHDACTETTPIQPSKTTLPWRVEEHPYRSEESLSRSPVAK